MIKNDRQTMLDFFKAFGIKSDLFTERKLIPDDALAQGSVAVVSLNFTEFHFTEDGNFIGTSDNRMNSFESPIPRSIQLINDLAEESPE